MTQNSLRREPLDLTGSGSQERSDQGPFQNLPGITDRALLLIGETANARVCLAQAL